MMNSAENKDENGAAIAASAGSETAGNPNPGDQHSDPAPLTEEEWAAYQDQANANAYMELVPAEPMTPSTADDAWKGGLIMGRNRDGGLTIEKKSQNNIYLMTRYSEPLRGIFILNEFSRRKMVVRCPSWEREDKFKPRDVRDDDYSRVCMELERLGLSPTRERASAAIEAICHDRSFHPVQRYFRSLKWDGKRRLHSWLTYYLGAETDPADYLTGVGTKWMVAAVARIYQPGCKFDHMLVLEGQTDIGKSAALRKLATFHGEEYFYDGMTFAKIGDKDTMQNIQGSLIIEFPELSSLHSREVEDVKQWITIQEDRGRKPYGREPVIYPRQFVLAGSTNNNEYLKDATGNKRFWPVNCGKKLDLVSLEKDREQLWAEAVHLYKEGYQWWITDDILMQESKNVQKLRLVVHPWTDHVLDYAYGRLFVSTSEILIKALNIDVGKFKRSDEMIVADILKANGYKQTRQSSGKRGWERE